MLYNLNPYVCSVQKIAFAEQDAEMHTEQSCTILYSTSASFEVALEDESVTFHKNSFMFLPVGISYSIGKRLSVDGDAYAIAFDLTPENATSSSVKNAPSDERLRSEFMPTERVIWYADAMHLMEELENFRATWGSSEPYAKELCSAKLKIILLKMLAGDMAFGKGVTTMRLRHALRYIEAHYAEPITNEEIAASVKLHPYYLSRLIKQECGVGLHRYLLDYRLAVAARMLETGEDNVENISAQCGFSYSSHFITAFRRAYGMSPKRYAQTHRSK